MKKEISHEMAQNLKKFGWMEKNEYGESAGDNGINNIKE